jgi:GNAT superfamily N-acetyltransferase
MMAEGEVIKLSVAVKDDFEEVYEMHKKYFGELRSPYVWEWEYGGSNPFKSAFVIARHEDKIVATQGMMIIPLVVNGKVYESGKNESLLIDSEFRGRGLYRNLYQFALDEYGKYNIICLWGFTKKEGAFTSVGFSFDRILSRSVLLLDPGRGAQLYKNNKSTALAGKVLKIALYPISFYCRMVFFIKSGCLRNNTNGISVTKALKDENDTVILFEKIRGQYPGLIHIHQDRKYMSWRIDKSPREMISCYAYDNNELKGSMVLEINTGYIEISELIYTDYHVGRLMAGELRRIVNEKRPGTVVYLGNKLNAANRNVFSLLSSLGFLRMKGPNGFVLNIYSSTLKDSLLRLRDWYITGLWTEGI